MPVVRFVLPCRSLPMLAASVVLAVASSALAAGEPDPTCRGAKLKAAGKHAATILGCDAKAAKEGLAIDPACLSKADAKISEAFSKAESKTAVDCNGIDVSTKLTVEETVDDVNTAAPVPVGGGDCVSAVHKAAGKFAGSYLGAWSKFQTAGDATKRDEAITKAHAKLTEAITKAETKTGCSSTGQGAAVQAALEDGLAPLLECMATSAPCIEGAAEVPAGGSVTTDPEGEGPDTENPVTAGVETPNAGTVVLRITEPDEDAPYGYEVLGSQIEVTAPDATTGDPLVLTFVIDASLLPPDINTVSVARNGVPVADCSGAPGTASPDPCIASRTLLGSGDLEIVCLSSQASLWTPLIELPVTF